jgi:hypothetical protein
MKADSDPKMAIMRHHPTKPKFTAQIQNPFGCLSNGAGHWIYILVLHFSWCGQRIVHVCWRYNVTEQRKEIVPAPSIATKVTPHGSTLGRLPCRNDFCLARAVTVKNSGRIFGKVRPWIAGMNSGIYPKMINIICMYIYIWGWVKTWYPTSK